MILKRARTVNLQLLQRHSNIPQQILAEDGIDAEDDGYLRIVEASFPR
jgi:hypothetical protein